MIYYQKKIKSDFFNNNILFPNVIFIIKFIMGFIITHGLGVLFHGTFQLVEFYCSLLFINTISIFL